MPSEVYCHFPGELPWPEYWNEIEIALASYGSIPGKPGRIGRIIGISHAGLGQPADASFRAAHGHAQGLAGTLHQPIIDVGNFKLVETAEFEHVRGAVEHLVEVVARVTENV